MDKIDKKILRLLQIDSKKTIKELAEIIGLTQTPVYERIKKLENEGLIKSYKAVVDREKTGLSLLVFCNVSLHKHQSKIIAQFESDILNFPEVIECYHVTGMYDYLLKIVIKDMAGYQEFVTKKLASLDTIRKVQSSFVMTEVKESAVLPV
ncbi:MAG: AsnC family transcriptional regulator [Flavobacteriales bacterium]|nr:MAG: AsnC family transcriptional regulator [Flavobacteriales bacterium]PIE48945.1 MAG: AsnC family transcriptional regulator [Flavobacteriales bacterium]